MKEKKQKNKEKEKKKEDKEEDIDSDATLVKNLMLVQSEIMLNLMLL